MDPIIWKGIITAIGGIIAVIIGKSEKWSVKSMFGGIAIGLIIGAVIGFVIYPIIIKESVPPPEVLNLSAPLDVSTYFHPSGWMGDGKYGKSYIELNTAFREERRSDGICIRVSYKPGSEGWAGIYWQYPDSNWGDQPGSRIMGAKNITFWARGEKGGEIVEFKAGGIRDSKKIYRDSFEVSTNNIILSDNWKRYEIDLARQDLSHVIGAFAWVATKDANPQGLVFYLDDIRYE